MAKLLEGKIIAQKIKDELKSLVRELKTSPVLASIMVGENPGASAYLKSQSSVAQELGISYQLHRLPCEISQQELIDFVLKLNNDPAVNGIMVQIPLPPQIDYLKVCEFILPVKDVEGMHPANMGRIVFGRASSEKISPCVPGPLSGKNRICPCTAEAVMELLSASGTDLYGKEAVVIGHSEIIGKPLAMLLLEKSATVTVCHIATSEAGKLKEHIGAAEVLVVAVGKAGLIPGEWIREGAVVVDVGINCVDGKILGDVEFAAASKRASFITPVPGGVGPLTVAILMRNLVRASCAQQ